MILATVGSSTIHAIGWDRESQEMEVIFISGGIYIYADVPQDLFEEFLSAPSKGRFFQKRVRGCYQSHRLAEAPAPKPAKTAEWWLVSVYAH